MPTPEQIQKDRENHELQSGLMARLEVARLSGEKLVDEYRERVAQALLQAGITLIPSDHLQDHQYVVSRGVYEAAKKLIAK